MKPHAASLWLPGFAQRHRTTAIALMILGALASPWITPLSLSLQIMVVAGAVGLAGLPHGALDLALLRGAGLRARAIFAAAISYLLLSTIVLALFASYPVTALAGFLLISWIHFGLGDTEQLRGVTRGIEAAARGALIIVAPVYFHPTAVATIFEMITGQDSTISVAAMIAMITRWVAPVSLGLLATAIILRIWRAIVTSMPLARYDHSAAALEVTLTLVIFALWPPLMAFLIYFCCIHSVRHLAEIGAARHPTDLRQATSWLVQESWPFTVVTLLLAAGIGWGISSHLTFDSLFARLVFQGLAALTVPHMVVSFWLHSQGEPKPGDYFSASKPDQNRE